MVGTVLRSVEGSERIAQPLPGEPRRIRRGMFRTIASPHPAGTLVTLVTAERIEGWSQWRREDVARHADS
jgi:hypothetical protein